MLLLVLSCVIIRVLYYLDFLWLLFFQHQVLIYLLILGCTFQYFRVMFYNTCILLKASNLTTRVIRKSKWHHTDVLTLFCWPSEGIVGFLLA